MKPRSFQVGDHVLRMQGEAWKDRAEGKLTANWGGPFRVTKNLGNGAYKLEELFGKAISRTWNASFKILFQLDKHLTREYPFSYLSAFIPR